MQILKADTQVDVRMGPFVDVGDGFTPETAVTLAGGGDNADEAEMLEHNGAATVDISGNAWDPIPGCDGWYDLTLTAAQLDTEGLLDIVIQNDSVHLPVHARFMVVNANVYDSLFAAATTDYLQTDVTQIAAAAVATGTAQLGVNVVNWNAQAVTLSTGNKPDVNVDEISDDSAASGKLELLVENVLGADNKALISTDAQDLSGTLDVNTKTMTAGVIDANAIANAAIDNATFAADVGATAYATNIIALAVRKALDELNLDHLMKVAVSDRDTMPEVVDDTVLANIMTKTDGDTSDFDHATDSLEALRDEVDGLQGTDGKALISTDAQDLSATLDVNTKTITAGAVNAGAIATDAIDADALNSDAVTEIWNKAMVDIAAGAPSATCSVLTAINYLYEAWRNKTVTSGSAGDSEIHLYKNGGAVKLCEAPIADDGTSFTKGEYEAAD
ncbi:MAG: hypothetical protein AMJ75_00355 [Phycisphaerae bacterium SM1_79]|nr:MAG: hypothetical protein AMJ75_00355 [Phycisphaerae bacterium SM1_79]